MSPERWLQIEDLLDQALDLPPEDRPALLDVRCAGDETLRRDVEAMLASCEEAGRFLEEPFHEVVGEAVRAFVEEEDADTALGAGDAVGPYRIVRSIGHGGMGMVYLAERADGQFDKRVALKVVKRGMDTDEIVRRFRYERQILARLEHPNIARLLDGGVTPDGLPYFVMEYVEGEPIDTYCEQRQCTVEERLDLFQTVCEAVQYAHQNLVVHRDLKPGNVLVAEDGTVKLLDFGIAKVLDADERSGTLLLTQTEARRMTPEYAAPEQVRGEPATTATDVYALGIILYKLLTGRRPYQFKSRSLLDIEAVVCEQVPERPSTAITRPVEEEAAPAPSDTLRRLLSGDLDAITMMALKKEPERRYPSAGELLADLRRYRGGHPVHAQDDSARYRAAKFVRRHKAAVVLASLVVLVLLTGAITTTWQAIEATRNARRAAQEATRAAQEAARSNAISESIIDMLLRVNPDRVSDHQFTARDLLNAGLPEIDDLQDQPLDQAAVMNVMGRISLGLGLLDLADSLHQHALAIQHREAGATVAERAESLMLLAKIRLARKEAAEAERRLQQAIALDSTHVASYANLGFLYHSDGRLQAAAQQFEKVIELAPSDHRGYISLGVIYHKMEEWEKEREMYERAIALEPSSMAYSNLATLYYFIERRYDEAARMYEEALKLNPEDYRLWGHLASAYYWTPSLRHKARDTYRRAVQMAEERLQTVNQNDPAVLATLATYYAMLGDERRVMALNEQVLALAPEEASVYFDIGHAYEQIDRRQQALFAIRKALEKGYSHIDVEREPGLAQLTKEPAYQLLVEQYAKSS